MDAFLNALQAGFKIFQDNILTKPEFFVGLLVFIGYLLLKKPIYEAFAGFLKATVGYMILNVAASGLVTTFRPILAGLNDRFQLNAAVIDPYYGLAAVNAGLKDLGLAISFTTLALLVGFFWNILLVALSKITKIRTLFVTGHIMVQQATTVTWIVFLAIPELRNMGGVALVGLLVGTYWAVFSNLTVECTQELTDNAGFAVGHQQMFGVWLTHKISPKLGKKEKSLENIQLPKALQIFNDNVVASSVMMLFFFGAIMLVLGEPFLRELDKTNFPASLAFPTYIVNRALIFAVYVCILQLGVRMFVAELTESFRGISEKLLPGALPAVDCAATYGFAHPNAITFGFLFGMIGQFVAIAGLLVFHSPIMIITGFVPVFFDNATFAVYANKGGGARAAAIVTFASGVLQVLGGAVAAVMFGLAKYGGWHGNFDFDNLWLAIGWSIQKFGVIGVVVSIVIMLVIPQLQYRRNKVGYHDHVA